MATDKTTKTRMPLIIPITQHSRLARNSTTLAKGLGWWNLEVITKDDEWECVLYSVCDDAQAELIYQCSKPIGDIIRSIMFRTALETMESVRNPIITALGLDDAFRRLKRIEAKFGEHND